MTSAEFLKGWLLLTAQPWGKPYRSNDPIVDGQPSPAKIQAEFYWQAIQPYHGQVWWDACTQHAAGERWPSLDALTATMAVSTAPSLRLEAQAPEGVSMEEALKERPDLLAVVKRVLA